MTELEAFLTSDSVAPPFGFLVRMKMLCQHWQNWDRAHMEYVDAPITTVSQLCALTDAEILRAPNIGKKTLHHLRSLQARNGIGVREDSTMSEPTTTAAREILQIAGMANGIVALCGDGTLWCGTFTVQVEGVGFTWRRVPDVPQGDTFKTID